jgi:hypothetical protein
MGRGCSRRRWRSFSALTSVPLREKIWYALNDMRNDASRLVVEDDDDADDEDAEEEDAEETAVAAANDEGNDNDNNDDSENDLTTRFTTPLPLPGVVNDEIWVALEEDYQQLRSTVKALRLAHANSTHGKGPYADLRERVRRIARGVSTGDGATTHTETARQRRRREHWYLWASTPESFILRMMNRDVNVGKY